MAKKKNIETPNTELSPEQIAEAFWNNNPLVTDDTLYISSDGHVFVGEVLGKNRCENHCTANEISFVIIKR